MWVICSLDDNRYSIHVQLYNIHRYVGIRHIIKTIDITYNAMKCCVDNPENALFINMEQCCILSHFNVLSCFLLLNILNKERFFFITKKKKKIQTSLNLKFIFSKSVLHVGSLFENIVLMTVKYPNSPNTNTIFWKFASMVHGHELWIPPLLSY